MIAKGWYRLFDGNPGPDYSLPVITKEQEIAERSAARERVAIKREIRRLVAIGEWSND